MKLPLIVFLLVQLQAGLNDGRIIDPLGDSARGHEYTANHKKPDISINGIPEQLDWRNYGVVAPVRNQRMSGSYFIPVVVEMIESELAVKTGKLSTLSLQQISDCCSECGREGNSPIKATWKYIEEFGLESEEDYPQEAGTNPCKYNSRLVVPGTRGTKFQMIFHGNETNLEVECAERGPVFVMVDVKQSFELYSSGVFYDKDCDPDRLNHAMLLVGYGREGLLDYWLVKNSWGEEWGDKGYAKMSRNRNDNCGIANFAFTAVFPPSHQD